MASTVRKHPERFHRQLSLVVIGDINIGKTSLSKRFASGLFQPVQPTVHLDFHVRSVEMRNGKTMQVRVWDTAGTEKHRALTPVLFRGVHGCMCVYDCTNAASFHNVPQWAQVLKDYTQVPVPCVLVANKTDLGEVRAVLPDEGAALARELGACRFFETSAKDGSNVDAAFFALLDAILKADDDEVIKSDEEVDLENDGGDSQPRSCACVNWKNSLADF